MSIFVNLLLLVIQKVLLFLLSFKFRKSFLNNLAITLKGVIIIKKIIIIIIGEKNLPKISPNLIHKLFKYFNNFGEIKINATNNKDINIDHKLMLLLFIIGQRPIIRNIKAKKSANLVSDDFIIYSIYTFRYK